MMSNIITFNVTMTTLYAMFVKLLYQCAFACVILLIRFIKSTVCGWSQVSSIIKVHASLYFFMVCFLNLFCQFVFFFVFLLSLFMQMFDGYNFVFKAYKFLMLLFLCALKFTNRFRRWMSKHPPTHCHFISISLKIIFFLFVCFFLLS